MSAIRRYLRPSSLPEALAAMRLDPAASWLAGGTLLLAGDSAAKPEAVIDLAAVLPREISSSADELFIGAGATFQGIAEARIPPRIAEAALTMVNRNTRNRATLGGNMAADKSCSSLVPLLLVLGAEVEVVSPASPAPERLGLEAWLREREAGVSKADSASASSGIARGEDLILRLIVPLREGALAAYRRWNRVACDLSLLGAAVAFRLAGGKIEGIRIALGGLGPKARRFPEIEALFEGSAPPSREDIEAAVAPRLRPIDDLRASASFKRLRGAQLLADALVDALRDGMEVRT